MTAADLTGLAPVCPVEPPEVPATGVGTRETAEGATGASRTEPSVHACPRCRVEVPVGVLYGPCAACRAALAADGAPDEPEAER